MDIEEQDTGTGRTLVLRGELDIAGVPALERRVREACEGGSGGLTLDLRGLTFLDSSGIAAIVFASTLCEKDGLEFSLIRGRAAIQRLFVLTGLADQLPFRDAAED